MKYRLPTSQLTLPYSFEDIKFPVNRISDNIIFNDRVQKINDNFEELLSLSIIVDNNSPLTFDNVYDYDSETWVSPLSASSLPEHNYIHIETVEKHNGEYLFICVKTNQIDFFTSNTTTPSPLNTVINYNQIKDRGSQKFKNISFVKYYNENLYVYDSINETIMVYNLIPLLTDDSVIDNIKFLKHFFKLKNIKSFDVNSNIYALSNNELLIYNSDFNLIQSYTLEENNPIDILLNNNIIYILYDSLIQTYSLDGKKISEYPIIPFSNTELFLKINFSEFDDNIIYILTNKFIYKYTSTDFTFVSYFSSPIVDNNYLDFIILNNNQSDDIFVLDKSKLLFFKDKVNTVLLYDEINLKDKIDLTNLTIKNLELEQDFVYNSIIQKLIFNNLLLYNSLIYKGIVETDSQGVLKYSYLENLVNITNIELKTIFYGQNEVFSFQVFNRAFNEIYNIQQSIVDLLQMDVTENTTNTLII